MCENRNSNIGEAKHRRLEYRSLKVWSQAEKISSYQSIQLTTAPRAADPVNTVTPPQAVFKDSMQSLDNKSQDGLSNLLRGKDILKAGLCPIIKIKTSHHKAQIITTYDIYKLKIYITFLGAVVEH